MPNSRLILTLAMLALGCRSTDDAPPAAPPLATVRDSSGIAIVENRLPAPGELPVWRLDPAPLLNLGTVAGVLST